MKGVNHVPICIVCKKMFSVKPRMKNTFYLRCEVYSNQDSLIVSREQPSRCSHFEFFAHSKGEKDVL